MEPEVFEGMELLPADQRSSGEQTSEDEDPLAQLIVFYPDRPAVPYKLHQGVNVVGRQSSFAQRDALRLHQWSMEYTGAAVHGIFLEGSSVSSAHAVIYVEGYGEACYVKDLKSRNKTFIKRGGRHVALEPHAEVPVQADDVLTFGALKCRLAFSTPSEGGAPLGSSPPGSKGGRAISRAVSIGQRTAAAGAHATASGRSVSLDKCPSLQEWFQHPARSPSGGSGGTAPSPFSGAKKARSWEEHDGGGGSGRASLDISSKPSFGFGPTIHEGEEQTSSEPEPETPRIDRPGGAAFSSPGQRSARSPFAGGLSVAEREDEGAEASAATTVCHPMAGGGGGAVEQPQTEARPARSSLELGAATLAQLKGVPLGASLAGAGQQQQQGGGGGGGSLPGTPNTEELSREPSRSPSPSPQQQQQQQQQAEAGEDAFRGRPARPRPKTPPPKRSRSGRLTSPEKSSRRSKSPRLQRGFELAGGNGGAAPERLRMDEIRDGLRDICPDV